MAAPTLDTDSEDDTPPGWEERVTLDGKVYYANHTSKDTQWGHPVSGKKKRVAGELPYGWERKISESEQVFFVDHINERTTYTDPRLAFAVEEKNGKSREIKQRFDGGSSALQVLQGRDLTGFYYIVTGANSGIGFEVARTLILHGAHVVLACRNLKKAKAAMAAIRVERSHAQLTAHRMDLCCLKTVHDFAREYLSRNIPLHGLILNAGVFSLPHSMTEDGYETTFQSNHLGHFYLVQLLLERLKASQPSRIVCVSAESHRFSDLNSNTISEMFLSPPSSQGFRPFLAYNQSKLCNLLFAQECHRRYACYGITCNAAHPGNLISTGITRHWWIYRVLFTLVRPFAKSKQQGAATVVFCACAQELDNVSGYYFNNCFNCQPSDEALRARTAEHLWRISEEMVLQAKSLQPG